MRDSWRSPVAGFFMQPAAASAQAKTRGVRRGMLWAYARPPHRAIGLWPGLSRLDPHTPPGARRLRRLRRLADGRAPAPSSMKPAPLDPAVTRWCADAICGAFTEYHRHFRQITARARQRFASRDWAGHQQDALERLEIVSDVVHQIVMVLRAQLGPPVRDKGLWERMKELYCGLAAALPEVELAETFFNSVTRRIFDTVGVDPKIEFVAPLSEPMAEGAPIFSTWVRRGSTEELLTRILRD